MLGNNDEQEHKKFGFFDKKEEEPIEKEPVVVEEPDEELVPTVVTKREYKKPAKFISEPTRVADGEEFGQDFTSGSKRPKWMIAKGTVQKMLLDAVGKTYFATHNERSAVIAIDKSALYLNSGIISVYPTEWVEQCVEWAKRKRRERVPVTFTGLINLINNDDRKTEFITKWAKDHPEVQLHKNAVTRPVEEEEEINDTSHLTE